MTISHVIVNNGDESLDRIRICFSISSFGSAQATLEGGRTLSTRDGERFAWETLLGESSPGAATEPEKQQQTTLLLPSDATSSALATVVLL